MLPADETTFVKTLNAMAAMKPHAGGKLTPESIDLYWRSMQDWSIQDFTAAAAHLLKHHPYPSLPLPADFEKLRRAGEPTAEEAWNLVITGMWLPPGSRVWRAAETLGGQQTIRHQDIEKTLPFTRKAFLVAYEGMSKMDPVRDALPQVAAHGARAALSAPTNIAALLPAELTQRSPQPAPVALPAPSVASTPAKVALPPPASARDKIIKLLPLLGEDDDAIAKVARESVEVVRQVRREQQGRAA